MEINVFETGSVRCHAPSEQEEDDDGSEEEKSNGRSDARFEHHWAALTGRHVQGSWSRKPNKTKHCGELNCLDVVSLRRQYNVCEFNFKLFSAHSYG